MNIELSKSEILLILDSLLKNHVISKASSDTWSEDSTAGLTNPKELQMIYNKILVEAQEKGLCSSLDTIGGSIN